MKQIAIILCLLALAGCQGLDSTGMVIPRSYRYDKYEPTKDDDESESNADSLAGRKWVGIRLDSLVNGYSVSMKLYPDNMDDFGWIKYNFKSEGASFDILTGYCWYTWHRELNTQDEDVYGKTYRISGLDNLVQGNLEAIKPAVFLFKDVDFDGEYELCFREPGYNREYYIAYKIIDGEPVLLTSRPYNNIVYSDWGNGSTLFDYSQKRITVDEQFGAACHWTDLYEADSSSSDPLRPMRHLSGYHSTYCPDRIIEELFENGKLVKEKIEYYVLPPYEALTAVYSAMPDESFVLDSISVSEHLFKNNLHPVLSKWRLPNFLSTLFTNAVDVFANRNKQSHDTNN